MSNLIFIYLGFKGLRDAIKYSHPPVFVAAFIMYLMIGFGSIAFHATLWCEYSWGTSRYGSAGVQIDRDSNRLDAACG